MKIDITFYQDHAFLGFQGDDYTNYEDLTLIASAIAGGHFSFSAGVLLSDEFKAFCNEIQPSTPYGIRISNIDEPLVEWGRVKRIEEV
ncbi:hypothetical protein CXH73_24495 [Salmonella enterica]|nr:hypothetical protein [Salmonella enterica]